jgi:hypothetical protein
MDDQFFQQNAVTYTGEVNMDPVEKTLTSDGMLCTIDIVATITGLGNVMGTLMGEISMDGTMCDFAGTTFEVTDPVMLVIEIVSGQATLSSGGQTLSLSDIVFINPFNMQQQTIDGFSCNCFSVDPIL